ncbi:MAG: hypothetical protein ACRDPJ_06205 [Nocardioidaceae bacterium]
MSLAETLQLEIPVASVSGQMPWWEPVLFAAAIAAVLIYGASGSPPEPEKAGASEAAAHETRDIDRTLTGHATGIMQVIAILAAGFVSAVKIGSLSTGIAWAAIAALLISLSLAGWALALVGEPLLISGLHEDARVEQADRATRRVHRRARLLALATWCCFPAAALVVIAGSIALLGKSS